MNKGLSKQAILSSVPFVCAVDLAIALGCLKIQGFIMDLVPSGTMDPFAYDALMLGTFVIPIVVTLAFMYVTKRESLRVFGGGVGRSSWLFFVGMLIGLALNAGISAVVGLTGSVTYTFNGMNPMLLVMLPFSFVQCTGEEVTDRGFLPAYLEERHSRAVVAIATGGTFCITHLSNIEFYGFNAVFCANVFLLAVVLYLLTKLFDTFWVAPGFHMAWNFTQEYLFGLPNSGYSASYALARGDNAQSGFFYDVTFGNEGSLLTLVVILVTVCVLIALLRRKESRTAESQAV